MLHGNATIVLGPALHIKPTAIPAVHPVTPKIAVGAYYFPGWKTAGSWDPITRFPERRPALGWYREGSPEVADWQIRWAVEHGITFFAYDWYWQQGVQQLDHGLKDGLFRAKNPNLIQFCLLWANHNSEGSSSQQDILAASDFWIKEYFNRPEYLTVEGKPIVIIFSPYRFRADLTSAGVRKAYDALHQHCLSAPGPNGKPLKGIYLIACVNSPEEARLAEQEGYDAVSAYNWPGLGAKNAQRTAPYADLPAAYLEQWQNIIKSSSLPLIPPISGGWDNRPWAGDAAFVRSDRTPALFKKHLLDAADFIKLNTSKTLPMVLIEAWNEWGEGSYIEPQQQYGFGYLDAIRDVFGPKGGSHIDFTPADAGIATPEVVFRSLDMTDWNFAQTTSGWENGMQVTPLEIVDGMLTVRTLGTDPALFGPPVQFAAAPKHILHLRLRETVSESMARPLQQDTAQIFWSTRTSAQSEDNSIRFPIKVDGEWHEITLDLSLNPHWRGVITRLRFDPGEHPGVTIQVKSLRVSAGYR